MFFGVSLFVKSWIFYPNASSEVKLQGLPENGRLFFYYYYFEILTKKTPQGRLLISAVGYLYLQNKTKLKRCGVRRAGKAPLTVGHEEEGRNNFML